MALRDRAYVTAIEPHNSGYTVYSHDLTRAGRKVSVVGKRVIVACGTIAAVSEHIAEAVVDSYAG